MGVDFHRQADPSVPEKLHDNAGMNVERQKQTGSAVP
jgi:hypothetical protein